MVARHVSHQHRAVCDRGAFRNAAFVASVSSLTNFIFAISGFASASSGTTYGVNGQSDSTSGAGVRGLATANGGISVLGDSDNDRAIPVVARASSTQTANLQEWQNHSGTALSAVDPSGRLGVGTASPAIMLHVVNKFALTQGNALVMDTPLTGQQALLGFWSAGMQKWQFGKNADGSFSIWDQAGTKLMMKGVSNGDLLPVPGPGNVGIGGNPSQKLTVNGNVLANAYNTPSDIRLKENITPIPNALEKIKQLNGVYFNWNESHEGRMSVDTDSRQVGVIAQDVEKVLPEIVTGKEHLSVDYTKLVPVLIQAMKEQQREIVQQQRDIIQLKAIVKRLAAS